MGSSLFGRCCPRQVFYPIRLSKSTGRGRLKTRARAPDRLRDACGIMVRRTDDGLGIADLKTGKTAVSADGTVKTQGHAAQVGVYEILAQAALGVPMEAPAQIIGLQVAKTDKGRRVGTGEISFAREVLLDGPEGEPGFLRMASRLVHSGDFYGNPRSPLCSEKFCPAYRICRWRK